MTDFINQNKLPPEATPAQKAETPYARFRRWYQLNERQEAGETLSEFELRWKEGQETTAEWEGHKLILDEFGIETFNEG